VPEPSKGRISLEHKATRHAEVSVNCESRNRRKSELFWGKIDSAYYYKYAFVRTF